MIRQVIDAAPRSADAEVTCKGSVAMDKREILLSLFAAAAFTALLAHGFKAVRAGMPADASAVTQAALCVHDARTSPSCPPGAPGR